MGRKSRLIPHVLKIIGEYEVRLTIRQIFYRLVSAGVIPNTRSAYNSLDKAISQARKKGVIPFDAIVDRSRNFIGGDTPYYLTPEQYFNGLIENLKTAFLNYDIPYWLNQPIYIEVWLEKDALTGFFKQITDKYRVVLAPCRGYPSLTFLYEGAKRLSRISKPKLILYFGDYDMRGIDIQRHITETLENFGLTNFQVKRVALTREQIEAYQLPPNPAKSKDTMFRGWIEKHGNVAWELDALEPKVLMTLIENAILQNIDKPTLNQRNNLLEQNRLRLKSMIENLLQKLNSKDD